MNVLVINASPQKDKGNTARILTPFVTAVCLDLLTREQFWEFMGPAIEKMTERIGREEPV